MDDRDRNKPKRSFPLSGDYDRSEDTTDRISLPASVGRAFDKTDERFKQLEEECSARHDRLRDRAHDLADDLNEHILKDTQLHTDLTGKDGTNGKLGRLRGDVDGVRKILIAIAMAVLTSLGVAAKALITVGEERGEQRTRMRQLETSLDLLQRRAEENRAALIRAGLVVPVPSFQPALPPASTPGVIP
jgi:hypothetical protein